MPNLNDSELHSAIPKLDTDKPNQNVFHEGDFHVNNLKIWLMKLRIIQYFYFPSNDEVFLNQYEFMTIMT